jgi:hypothetical protein
MSSISMALAAWLNTLSAARTRVDAGAVGGGSTGGLLQSRDRLPTRLPARLPVSSIELRHLEPPQECSGSDAGHTGGFLEVALCERC